MPELGASRRFYGGRDFRRALSIEELRRIARRRLPSFVFEFVESGGEDEVSLAWNRHVFRQHLLVPRALVDTSQRHSRTTYLGRERPSPLIIAPTGHNCMLWKDGDTALARAASGAGIPFTLSTMSNTRLEQVAESAGGELWMQLYSFRDRDLTRSLLDRSREAGYQTLVFTVDANVFGWREWDRRKFRAPGKLTARSMGEIFTHPGWVRRILLPDGPPKFANVIDYFPPEARDTRSTVTRLPDLFHPDITWDTVSYLRDAWPGKLLIKGLLSVDDAERAAELGCDGIVLSNHGARHLDSCISPMDILSETSRRVGKRMTIIVDSGFRRGSDIVKAVALGADAVMLGRATLYGLASGGEAGAAHAIKLLNDEIIRVLGQIGVNSLDAVDASCLHTAASGLMPVSASDIASLPGVPQ